MVLQIYYKCLCEIYSSLYFVLYVLRSQSRLHSIWVTFFTANVHMRQRICVHLAHFALVVDYNCTQIQYIVTYKLTVTIILDP